MKKTVILLAALLGGLSLRAEGAVAATQDYALSLNLPYTTKYVFRGVELGQGAIQPSLELASGGFTAGIWSSQPVTDNADNEFDFYTGYSTALNDRLTLDAGATLYYYPELDKSTGGQRTTFEPYVGLSTSIGGFASAAYVFYDFTLETLTVEGQIGYSVALEAAGTSLDFSAALGRVDPDVGSAYTYYSAGVAVPFRVSTSATVTLAVSYAHNNLVGADNDSLSASVGIGIGF